jgi:hypothetical protein
MEINCFLSVTFQRFYTQKRPIGKPVPLPKISSFESPNQPPYLNNINNNHQQQNSDSISNIKNTINNNNLNSNNPNSQMNNNQQLPLPPPPTGDENYAVTEL